MQSATGRSVPEILESDGEAAFQIEESKASALRSGALSRGWCRWPGERCSTPRNRELLRRVAERSSGSVPRSGFRSPIRVGSGAGRPLLAGDPEGNLRRLDAERRPLYEEIADVVVDVDDLAPDAVVDRIVAAVGRAVIVVPVELGDRSTTWWSARAPAPSSPG